MGTVLNVLTALPALVKIILELMTAAEKAMGAGTGVEKKSVVMSAIESIVGDGEIWANVQALFSGIINMIAMFRFGSKI
jgi:Na+-translocating ferredoxin:NAD+ oxidoreductase RnfE subunit